MARKNDCLEITFVTTAGRSVESRVVLRDSVVRESRKLEATYKRDFPNGRVLIDEIASLASKKYRHAKPRPVARLHHFQVVQ